MNSGSAETNVMRYLRVQAGDPATDGDLLARYVRGRDESAFAAVVQRYGGLVLGVARRQLADRDQADDVFQATFLALARAADRLGRHAPLANWLYTVALRQSRKLRARAARRRGYETACVAPPAPSADPLEEITGRELLRVVDEELARLPEKFRVPVLLCGVQGLSREEAARQIGCSVNTVKGRLERGRQRLAARLAHRGLAPAAIVLAPLAAITVPGDLLARASTLGAAPWASSVPAAVAALAASPRRVLPVALLLGSLLVAGLAGLAVAAKKDPPGADPPVVNVTPASSGEALPSGAAMRFGTSLYRHGTTIKTLAVSADGTVAVAGSGGRMYGNVHIFDLTTGRVRTSIELQPYFDEAAAMSPDGRTV